MWEAPLLVLYWFIFGTRRTEKTFINRYYNISMNQFSKKPLFGADNNALVALVSVSIIVSAVLGFFRVLYFLEGFTFEAYQTEVFQLATLIPQQILQHPWTLFTYNWTHTGFWDLFTNMIWLATFCNILQNLGTNKHLFPIYFYSGLVAGLVYIAIGTSVPFLGAQVGVIAIAAAATMLSPKYKFLANAKGGGLPLWALTLIYFALATPTLMQQPWQQQVATLVGGLTGPGYVFLLKKQIDLGNWMHRLLNLLNNSLSPKQ
ncbi:MAG: rhomboid family intramembrane serine protease, partial [Sediminibacterium sp.]